MSTTFHSDRIQKELTEKEILKIDMKFLGDYVLGSARTLSNKVDTELLKPINKWFGDSDWIRQIKGHSKKMPNWSQYKSRSRQWNKKQEQLAGMRLKLYWRAIRKKRNFRQKVAKLFGKTSRTMQNNRLCANDGFLLPVIMPFSKTEQTKICIKKEFLGLKGHSDLYNFPWRAMLSSEIKHRNNFSNLPRYLQDDVKMDKVCKFITLLQFEHEGIVILGQAESNDDFEILPQKTISDQVTIKDRQGNKWEQEWAELGNDDKQNIIAQIKAQQIICKQ